MDTFYLSKVLRDKTRLFIILLATFLNAALIVTAQSSGVVRGIVRDSAGAAVANANVLIENRTSGYNQRTTTNDEGRFHFFNVPFNSYRVAANSVGFAEIRQETVLRSNLPVELELTLQAKGVNAEVIITKDENPTEAAQTSEYAIDSVSVQNLTGALPSRQIENLVLSAPGVVRDGKGVFHARGAHNQSSFVIDGVPVSDQLSAIYANNFDARNVEGMSVQLGNIAPEFGNKASAVIQVTTQSGLGSKQSLFGSVNLGMGSFESGETSFKLGGQNKNSSFGWFVSAAHSFTARYLDPPFQNATADFGDGRIVRADGQGLNNRGNAQSLFMRFDYVPSERDFFKINIVAARSRFSVANTPSQELAGQRQFQENRNLAVYPSWQHVFNERWTTLIAPYLRFSAAVSTPSAGDIPITFGVSRHLPTIGAVANTTYSNNKNILKFGVDAFLFPSSETFDFQITDPNFNPLPANSLAVINTNGIVQFQFDPALSQVEINQLLINFNPNLLAYDRTIFSQAALNNSIITGAPRDFVTTQKQTGKQFYAYIQDNFTRGNFTVGGGLRFDRYSFLVNETALSPRVGIAYRVEPTATVLRASYNRIVQTPSTENLLISGTAPAATLVNPLTINLFGSRARQIRAERAHWVEFGVRQKVFAIGRFDVAYYRKQLRDFHDNDQFLNTTIIFPIAISRGRVQGVDARFDIERRAGFGGYFSIGFVQAKVTPPFSGGLFLSGASVDTLGGKEFTIDHDQRQTIQGAVQYSNTKRGIFAQLLVRHDGGLVTGVAPEDISTLAANPDTAAGIPLLDFNAEIVRVKPRTIIDAAFGYDFLRRERLKIGMQVDALNLTNRRGLYNYLSVFGGTNFIPARSFNVRLKFDF